MRKGGGRPTEDGRRASDAEPLHLTPLQPPPMRPGELYHKGIDITCGVRCLLVCFTDGMNPKILDDSKSEDYDRKDEGNVVIC